MSAANGTSGTKAGRQEALTLVVAAARCQWEASKRLFILLQMHGQAVGEGHMQCSAGGLCEGHLVCTFVA